MVPPLFLIFLVLGTIFIGVATPTEGGAMGATGSIILAIFKRYLDGNPNRFNFALLRSAVEATAKLSSFVVFILIGARIFSLTFYGVNGHLWVEHLLTSLPGGQVGFLVVRERPRILPRLLPRFLRDRLHHHSAARAGCRENRHRSHLARRDARREHADELHASAVRVRPLLPAIRGAARALQGPRHRHHDGARDHGPDLLGRRYPS